MEYVINYFQKFKGQENFNAAGKAPEDVIRTFSELNISGINIYRKFYTIPFTRKNISLLSALDVFVQCKKAFKSIKEDDVVYLQYPTGGKVFNTIIKLLLKRTDHVRYIIHDLESFRIGAADSKEIERLKKADILFVHTMAMKEILLSYGVCVPMKIMNFFDYYSDDPMVDVSEMMTRKNQICFAGNLGKSEFLPKLVASDIPNSIDYRLYGIMGNLDIVNNRQIEYCGSFKPSKTGTLKAGWGLVWDGPSIDTCTGPLGKYLAFNSSHKMSLYAVCGIPLVVWTKSSLSKWILTHNIGFAVDNLAEIPSRIQNISDEEYLKMVENVRALGCELRKGNFLKQLVNESSRFEAVLKNEIT